MNFDSLGFNFLVGAKRPDKSGQHTSLQAIPVASQNTFEIENVFTNADTWIESGLREVIRYKKF